MTKNPGNDGKGHYKEREVKVILEGLESQFRTFGEGLTDVRDRLEKVEGLADDVKQLKEDVHIIKLVIPTLARKSDLNELATKSELNAIKLVIPTLATKSELIGLATKSDLTGLATKSDLNAINLVIPTLATKSDLAGMEKRLTTLEHSR